MSRSTAGWKKNVNDDTGDAEDVVPFAVALERLATAVEVVAVQFGDEVRVRPVGVDGQAVERDVHLRAWDAVAVAEPEEVALEP